MSTVKLMVRGDDNDQLKLMTTFVERVMKFSTVGKAEATSMFRRAKYNPAVKEHRHGAKAQARVWFRSQTARDEAILRMINKRSGGRYASADGSELVVTLKVTKVYGLRAV